MKFLMYENMKVPLETGLALEHYAMGVVERSEDSREGIKSWFEKREPVFRGR